MARIIIKNQDGSIKQTKNIVNTSLILKGGKGINLTTSGNIISVVPSFSLEELVAALNSNYTDIINHIGKFSGNDGYYLSKINGASPFNNNLILNGDLTSQLEPAEYGLKYSDFGRPDVDCDDYARLKDLIDKLENYLDTVKDQIIQLPTIKDPETKTAKLYGVHAQYQALAKLWNYIVQVSTARLNVSYQNRSIFVQTSYLNHNNANAGKDTPVTCTITLKNYTGTDIPKLYATFARASFTSSKNNPNYPTYNPDYPDIQAELLPEDATGHSWIFTFPNEIAQGDTITLLTRFDITTTDSKTGTKKDIYTLSDQIQISRAVANMDIQMPESEVTNSPYQTYDEHILKYHKVGNPTDCNTQIVSTANPTIYSKQTEYSEDELGTYIITIDNYVNDAASDSISFKLTKNAETVGECHTTSSGFINLGVCSIVFDSGCLHPGDQFAVSVIKKTIANEDVPLIKDSNLMVEVNWNNVLFCSTNGNIQRSKKVNIIGEENDVGELTVSVAPTINTVNGGITGGGAIGGSVSGGSVSVGTVSVGTISVGTMSIGTVKQGEFYIGSVDVGIVKTGSVSVGTISIGRISQGTVSIGTVVIGTVSVGTVSMGTVSIGTVISGTVSIGSITMGTVIMGKVIPPTVSMGKVTIGNATVSSVITSNINVDSITVIPPAINYYTVTYEVTVPVEEVEG